MGRLMAIDFGKKRCGVAVTDILKICANAMPWVPTNDIHNFIKEYVGKEEVEAFIVGEPKDLKGNPSDSMRYITPFVNKLKKDYPHIPVIMWDERFTSAIAHQEMISAGLGKKKRAEKGLADQVAAVLILTSYLQRQNQPL